MSDYLAALMRSAGLGTTAPTHGPSGEQVPDPFEPQQIETVDEAPVSAAAVAPVADDAEAASAAARPTVQAATQRPVVATPGPQAHVAAPGLPESSGTADQRVGQALPPRSEDGLHPVVQAALRWVVSGGAGQPPTPPSAMEPEAITAPATAPGTRSVAASVTSPHPGARDPSNTTPLQDMPRPVAVSQASDLAARPVHNTSPARERDPAPARTAAFDPVPSAQATPAWPPRAAPPSPGVEVHIGNLHLHIDPPAAAPASPVAPTSARPAPSPRAPRATPVHSSLARSRLQRI